MSLLDKITNEMKNAMKARDKFKVNTLRMVMAQLKNKRIDSMEDLTLEQEIAVITNAAKKRKEAIEIYKKSNRNDLLEKEQKELSIISEYLPEQLSDEEIDKTVSEIVDRLAAKSLSPVPFFFRSTAGWEALGDCEKRFDPCHRALLRISFLGRIPVRIKERPLASNFVDSFGERFSIP